MTPALRKRMSEAMLAYYGRVGRLPLDDAGRTDADLIRALAVASVEDTLDTLEPLIDDALWEARKPVSRWLRDRLLWFKWFSWQ
jgi:hypothetical protein